MSFPRYPAYKDSGFEAVPKIPERWVPIRLRFLLRDGYDGIKIGPFGSQLTSDMLDDAGDYKVYGQEHVIANDFDRGSRYIDRAKFEELTAYEIKSGDLLVTMMGTSGRCDVVPSKIVPGVMDSHLLRIRVAPSVKPEFVRLLIDQSAYVGTQIDLAGKGSIMHGLNSTIVKNLLLFVPPVDEQAQILTFLDHETAKIDALVAEQERLIDLLKEKRQAVISHAVTKGLDPSVPMKDSGVEWLGEVPAHWALRPLKSLAKFRSGGTPDKRTTEYWDGDIPWASAKDLKVDHLLDTIDHITQFALDDGAAALVPAEAVVVVVRGMILARYFPVTTLKRPMAINQDLKALLPSNEVEAGYLAWLLRASEPATLNCLDEAGHGTKALRMENWGGMTVPVPPVQEQAAISAALETATGQLDSGFAELEQAISLLQERRTALISAAITGQIDVRSFVPPRAGA